LIAIANLVSLVVAGIVLGKTLVEVKEWDKFINYNQL
jgi:hypothetical protein